MAKIQFLTILLAIACFLGGVVSVTDKEFEDLASFVQQQSIYLHQQSINNDQLSVTVDKQSLLIEVMMEKIERQDALIKELTTRGTHEESGHLVEREDNLERITSNLETRLTAAGENIQGMQMTDVELDERVMALEESYEKNENDIIAFSAVLTFYDTIPVESAVLFNQVLLNEGDGYDSTTGTFTVPSGGNGFYYFSAYFVVWFYEYARIDIQLNGQTLCTAFTDQETLFGYGQSTCSAAAYATEGDTVQVVYTQGSDTTPLYAVSTSYQNGFTGFRI